MIFFYIRKLSWKFCVNKLLRSVSGRVVLGWCREFLTGDMKDRVIPDIMNDVFLPQERYPENFLPISLLEVCQEGGVKKGATWRMLRVSDQRHGGHGHSWCRKWCFLPQGRYPENFVLISQLEEGQEQISVGVSHSVTQSVRIADTELDSPELS